MKFCFSLFLLLFAMNLPAQPWLWDSTFTEPKAPLRPIAGLFKSEKQAGWLLFLYGTTSEIAGSWVNGRAARSIQIHGHSGDFDSYGMTRGFGTFLWVTGSAADGWGFAYRHKTWYKKRPVLWGFIEAGAKFGLNTFVAQYAYRRRHRLP